MIKIVLGILLLILQGCNVAEQTAVEDSGANQNAQSNLFDINDDKIFIGFRREQNLGLEYATEPLKTKLFRVGDDSEALTVTIQLLEDISSADQNDIASITDEDGNVITMSATSNPTFTVTFPPLQRTFDFYINFLDDSVYEGDETMTFKIVEPTGGEFFIRDYATHQVEIREDETPPITYVVNGTNSTSSGIVEGASVDLNFSVTPDVSKSAITYNLSYSGTANLDDFTSDYDITNPTVSTPGSPLPTKVILPAETAFKTIQFSAKSDSYAEINESLVVTITSVNTTPLAELDLDAGDLATYTLRQSHTINVTEGSGLSNDVSITGTCASIDENLVSSTCTVSVTLDDNVDEDTFVDLDFSGTATLAADYRVSTTRLTFLKDQGANQTKTFDIIPIDDNFRDVGETITVTLNPDSRLNAGAPSSTTININDDEAAVEVGFSLGAYQVSEGSILTIPVKLNNPSDEDIVVSYTISTAPADSATIGSDHNLAASGTFTVNAGELTSNSSFLTYNDAPFDDEEVIYLTLTGVSSGTASLNASTTLEITIREASALPILTFSESTQTVIEGNSLVVTLTTDKVSESAQPYVITLSEVTTSSSDYTFAPSQAAVLNRTFPAGVTTDTFSIAIDADTTLEPTENFILSLTSAEDKAFGSITNQIIDIVDNTTPPVLDLLVSSNTITEGSSGTLTMQYQGGEVSGFNVPISYTISGTSTSGEDHTLASGSVILLKNTNSVDVNFNIPDDDLFEGSETIIITIGANATKYSLGTSTETITITDAQAAPTVALGGVAGSGFDAYFDKFEGDSVNIPITLDHPSANDIDITLTVEDKWDTNDTCGSKCASIFDYDSIHKNLAQVSNNGMDNIASSAQVGTSSSYRITFSGVPTTGSIDLDFNDDTGANVGTESITAADITGINIEAVCDNLVNEINNHANGYIRYELYAFHKNGTDYVDIKPRPRILDTDLDQQITGNTITITIPAGSTQSVISFNLLNDDLYELGTDERFRVTITGTTGGTSIDASKDQAAVNIKDVHSLPRAQFVQKNYARIEPQTDTTAVISIPIYLSNFSEAEVDYKVIISNDPDGTLGYADENDFNILDTLSKTNSEASSVYNRSRGVISDSSGASVPLFPRLLYNETELGLNVIQSGFSATMTLSRKDSVADPNNAASVLTFISAGNSGSFDIQDVNGINYTIPVGSICGACTDTATAGAVSTYINTNYSGLLIAEQVAGTVEVRPAYLPSLKYTSNIVKEFYIKIPAGQDVDYIPIEIANDLYYEGTEKLTIELEQISGATAPVNTSTDSSGLANNVAFLQINDDESLSQITITSDTTNEPEGTPGTRTNIHSGTYTYNDVTYSVNISPLFQREDIQFEVLVSGDMTYEPVVSDPTEFMTGDYRFDISTGAGMDSVYAAYEDNGKIVMTYPAGYSNGDVQFIVKIHEDYRYEEDETITLSLSNNTAADIGSPGNNSITFSDDDSSYVYLSLDGLPSFPQTLPEYQASLDELTFIASDEYNVMVGTNITQVSASFDYTINGSYRHNTSAPDFTLGATLSLSSSTNYSTSLNIDQYTMGDFRQYDQITVNVTNLQDINYLSSYGVTSYALAHNLTVPDMKIKTSVHASRTADDVRSHSCTIFRGQVSCFGDNTYGQLGKGIADATWGDSSLDSVNDQDEVIDLGTSFDTGAPHYAIDIALGGYHTCVLLATNQVKCWGRNNYGQLGRGDTQQIGTDPVQMGDNLVTVDFGTDDEIESIHAALESTCAFFKDAGTVKCWGRNRFGILGLDDSEGNTGPIGDEITDMGLALGSVNMTNIEMFEMGAYHACAKRTNDEFGCWGYGLFGQLGNGSFENIGDEAGEVANDTFKSNWFNFQSSITDIAIGTYHTCVQFSNLSTYNVRCWGRNVHGQLGLGRVNRFSANDSDVNMYTEANIVNSVSVKRSNNTDMIGRRTLLDGDSPNDRVLEADGHRSAVGDQALNTPYSSTSAGFENLNLNVARNQHVQVYNKATDISAGVSFGCGVYSRYYLDNNTVNKKHIRCWGTNKLTGSNTGDSGTMYDFGLLNNIGWSKWFTGTFYDNSTLLPPFRTTYNGVVFADLADVYASGTGQRCASSGGSSLCNFAKKMSSIGKDSFSINSNSYLYNYYLDPDNDGTNNFYYQYGWLTNFENRGVRLNFEMNHAYSMVRTDFEAYDDIELHSGAFATCAMPKYSAPTNDYGANNEFLCWGNNSRGQLGVAAIDYGTCTTEVIGGFNTCSSSMGGVLKAINYTY